MEGSGVATGKLFGPGGEQVSRSMHDQPLQFKKVLNFTSFADRRILCTIERARLGYMQKSSRQLGISSVWPGENIQ